MYILAPFRNIINPGAQQVPPGASIDWLHPLANGLIFCCIGSHPYLDLTGKWGDPTFSGTRASFDSCVDGPALWLGDQSGAYITTGSFLFSSANQLTTGGNVTFVARAISKGTPSTSSGKFNGILTYGKTGDVIYSLSYSQGTAPLKTIWEVQNSVGSYQDAPLVTTPATNTMHFYAGVINGTTTTLWVDTTASSSGYTGTPKNGDSTYSLAIGLDLFDSGGARDFDGNIPLVLVYNRALTSDEVLYLYNNPYCFLTGTEGEMPGLFTQPFVLFAQSVM